MSDGRAQHIPRPPGVSYVEDPPPWAELSAADRRFDVHRLTARFAAAGSINRHSDADKGGRAAATLAAFYPSDDGVVLIFTRRAWHLRSHRGEVSLPGGGQEPDDQTLWDTATRETQEEIGLDPDLVTQVGSLDHLSTFTSNSFIAPFVGTLPHRPRLTPNPNEVDAILEVELADLLDPAIYHAEVWRRAPVRYPLHFFDLGSDLLWGATARMVVNAFRILLPDLDWPSAPRPG